jgi:HlyD family secretion protein
VAEIWRYKYVIAFIALSVLVLVRFGQSRPEKPADVKIVSVTRRSFNIAVRTIGNLDAARAHLISSEIRGDKGKIVYLVKDGTWVHTNDVLVKLDKTPFEEAVLALQGKQVGLLTAVEAAEQMLEWEKNQVEREIRTAQFDIQIARLELKKLQEGEGQIQLAQYREENQEALENYQRYQSYLTELEKLSDTGFDNHTEIQLAQQKLTELEEEKQSAHKKYTSYKEHVLPTLIESGKSRLERAQMELEQIRKGSVFKIAKAQAVVNEAKSKLNTTTEALAVARSDIEKSTILAPYPGIAILYEMFREGQKRKPRVGDIAWQNQPLLYLPEIASMVVKTSIREIDLHKISLGQSCQVRVDAYPRMTLEGRISFIGALASARSESAKGQKYFQLTIDVLGENTDLRPGMTARVSILTDQVNNALALPVQAVFLGQAGHYCLLYNGSGIERRAIKLGRQNEDWVEVVSGLKDGDRVSLEEPLS